jgi:hypothetical protein
VNERLPAERPHSFLKVASHRRDPAPDDRDMTNNTTSTEIRAWVRPGPLTTALLVMASAGAAAVHFAMVPTHSEESTVLAVGFAVVAWLQAAFAVGVLARPTRGLLVAGAGLNTVAIGVWAWSRLFGLPFGNGEVEASSRSTRSARCSRPSSSVLRFGRHGRRRARVAAVRRWSRARGLPACS